MSPKKNQSSRRDFLKKLSVVPAVIPALVNQSGEPLRNGFKELPERPAIEPQIIYPNVMTCSSTGFNLIEGTVQIYEGQNTGMFFPKY